MGFRCSPYWATRYYYFMEEMVIGDHTASDNPFRWDQIILHLPGDENFNPSLPFVIKWDAVSNRIAAAIRAYVDDLRVIAPTRELVWAADRQVAARLQYLGSQDAPRKRRMDNGPWAGTVFGASSDTVSKTVTQAKWDRGKKLIDEIASEIASDPNTEFEYKRLERVRGYLCHLAMTYDVFFPYLKGFHLTLTYNKFHCDEDGWKLSDLQWIGYVEQRFDSGKIDESEKERLLSGIPASSHSPPKFVKPMQQFYTCLNALQKFFSKPSPNLVHMRSTKVYLLAYGFADASGGGFGRTISKEEKVHYRMGVWGKDEQVETSYWKEFANSIEALEHESIKEGLNKCLVILALDNKTVESNLYKGNPKSAKLHELILRFKHLELHSGARFIISHVSGEHMKRQGTDRVSRGNL